MCTQARLWKKDGDEILYKVLRRVDTDEGHGMFSLLYAFNQEKFPWIAAWRLDTSIAKRRLGSTMVLGQTFKQCLSQYQEGLLRKEIPINTPRGFSAFRTRKEALELRQRIQSDYNRPKELIIVAVRARGLLMNAKVNWHSINSSCVVTEQITLLAVTDGLLSEEWRPKW